MPCTPCELLFLAAPQLLFPTKWRRVDTLLVCNDLTWRLLTALLSSAAAQGLAQLTALIFARAQPKRLGAQTISGAMLAGLASAYVDAINRGAVPTISTAWQARPPPVLRTKHPQGTPCRWQVTL